MIKIGTNFLYRGPLFLDSRHGIATSKIDLKNWSTPIPAGFEVYLNLENDPAWYTYKPDLDEPYSDTGYFEKRLDKAYVDSKITEVNTSIINIDNQINNIWNTIENINVQPNLTLEVISNAGRYESGGQVFPWFMLNFKNFGRVIDIQTTDADVLVDGVSIGNRSMWAASNYIYDSRSYAITVLYNDQTLRYTIYYTFEPYTWKKYFGVYNGSTLSNISYLAPTNPVDQGWSDTASVVYEGTLDCSGGKYPYYVFPASLYNENTFKMYVNGIGTTDFDVGTLTINDTTYKTIRTGYIQSGILQLRYE